MNKKKIALLCLALVLMGALGISVQYSHHIESLILLVLIAITLYFIIKDNSAAKPSAEDLLQEVIDLKGEPEQVITADPAHGYRTDGCILVYPQQQSFVINGKWVPWEKIGGLTFTNESLGYHLPNSYQIIMEVNTSPKTYLHIPTGNDLGWTQITLQEIRKAMKGASANTQAAEAQPTATDK